MKTVSTQTTMWNNGVSYDDHGLTSLRYLIDKGKIDLDLFFVISLNLCDILTRYSIDGVLNLRINPQNIFVDLKTNEVRIINKCFKSISEFDDFGGLESIGRESIPYISPELSGMMNRTVDYRSDFYSLGAVLYEMLTYKCPFEVSTPSELIYSHTAKLATHPYRINKNIPVPISNIVMKLLSKNPEERYRTSWGIKHDLERCLKEWKQAGKVNKFKLASKDIPSTFEIPQKDYGRRTEVKNILGAYNRIATGFSEIIVITGENGMGKSWVVERAKQVIVNRGGYFVSGKSNQINFNIPYESITQALRELVQKTLSESSEEMEVIRNELMEVMGNNIQVMLDLIPELKYILDSKTPLLELSSMESEYRFNMLFQRFIKVFSRENHPLVIFLDDVQWSHPASLRLITDLFKYYDNKYLLIILGYRGIINTRTKPKDHIDLLLHNLKDNNTRVTKVSLKPLNFDEVTRLLSDALHCAFKDVKELARVILNKTYGNPLFIDQLMKTLFDRKLLSFDYSRKAWIWDIEEITKESIPDNVVDIITQKLVALPQNTKKLLRLAACLRAQFDIQTLAVISENSLTDTLYYLNPAIETGLIEVVGDSQQSILDITLEQVLNKLEFKFIHDCIQQSAYSMIWKDNHADVHLKVGKLLLENCNSEEFSIKLFDIVNHLNYAKSLMKLEEQSIKLAGLNLIAGRKAKNANDYETAINYFNEGLIMLSNNKWTKYYNLTFQLSIECAECEFLLGHKINAEKLLEEIFGYTKSITDKIHAYIIQVKVYSSSGRYEEAVKAAMEGLKLINIHIEKDIDESVLLQQVREIQDTLSLNLENYIYDTPKLKDRTILYALKLILELSESAAFVDANIWKSCMLKIVNMSLEYGNCSVSAVGYVGLGAIICQTFNTKEGYRFGIIALNLASIYDDLYVRTRVFYIFGYHICPLKEDYSISLSYLQKSFEYAVSLGNLNYARYSANGIILMKLLMGKKLNGIKKEMDQYLNLIKNVEEAELSHFDILINYLLNIYKIYKISKMEELLSKLIDFEGNILFSKNKSMIALYYFVKIKLLAILGRYEEAVNIIINRKEVFKSQFGNIIHSSFLYISTLVICRFFDEDRLKFNGEHLYVIKQNLFELEKLSASNNENFLARYLLVSAEISRVEGKLWDAQIFYEKSLEQCVHRDYITDAALVCECASRFYMNQGLDTSALAYAKRANTFYEKSGSTFQFMNLDNSFISLMNRAEVGNKPYENNSIYSDESITNIDVNTAIKVSKIISEEIIMDKLLIKLMNIAMESAGAQKGFLILYQDDKLIIEVEGRISENKESKVKHISLEEFNNIGKSVIYYTLRTCEAVILNNAPLDSVFSSDNYIIRCRPQSIMCMPIVYNESVLGAIYLENSLAANVFKPTKLEVLRLISSQAAIAMENARMFKQVKELNDSLEKKVKERTKAIEETLIKLENEIQERNQAEKYLKESEERYKTLIHMLPVGICVRTDNEILFTNRIFAEIMGYDSPKELINKNFFDLIEPHPDFKSKFKKEILKLQEQGNMSLIEEIFIRKVDNEIVYLETSAERYPYDGKQAVLVVTRDISEKKKAERLNKEVAEKSKRLKEALEYDKLKTEFFANISHELRTPLNVILTANQMAGVTAEQLNNNLLKGKLDKYIKLTRQNCYRLIRLTNNLIDITKIDAGYIRISMCNCDIIKIIEDITLSVVEYAKRKDIELIFDTEVEEKYLACDPDMIERIILNLLSNAIKFTDCGGKIEICILDMEENIQIHVKDSGVGIPRDKLNSIFDRFVQVDKSLSRNCEGSGIGLSLVKSLVEMHKGTIEVQSLSGEGSKFIINLPVQVLEDEVCATLDISSKQSKVERINIEFSDIYF